AQNCVNGIVFRVADNGGFKFSDETDGVFYALFHVSAQRPIAETEPPPEEIDRRIQRKQKLITNVAGECQPLHVLHDRIQFVAVNDEHAASVSEAMNGVLLNLDVAISAVEFPEQVVVISRDINDPCALARFTKNLLDDVIVLLGPVNSA